MSKEITEYDVELGKRLEKIRKNHGLRQLDMANIMETDIGMYKRYAYAVRQKRSPYWLTNFSLI